MNANEEMQTFVPTVELLWLFRKHFLLRDIIGFWIFVPTFFTWKIIGFGSSPRVSDSSHPHHQGCRPVFRLSQVTGFKAKICRKPRFHQPTMNNFPCTSRLNCLFRPSSEASPAINRERLVWRKGFPCRWVVWFNRSCSSHKWRECHLFSIVLAGCCFGWSRSLGLESHWALLTL